MTNTISTLYAQKLAEMLRIPTTSDQETDPKVFAEFCNTLHTLFPQFFHTVEEKEFDGALLLRWKGRDETLEPLLFMNHYDVVSATGEWSHAPFSGDIAEEKVWGRGALDTKGGLFCMLQAAEELMKEGFLPQQDIYFVSTRDEETDSIGANVISKYLLSQNIRFQYVLDEGGMILYDPIGGANGTFAMIGVGEKGCTDIRFIAKSKGGHASMPGHNTPLVRLGKFMCEVEKKSIFTSYLSPSVAEMFRRFAPTMHGALKFCFGHPKLLRPLLQKLAPAVSPTANALFKTTLAFTMAQGSEGRNIIPGEASVVGNMRFSHHQGRDASLAALEKIAQKYDIEMKIIDPGFASPISDYHHFTYELIEKAVKEMYPAVYTTPYIMTGASDCRFFSRVSDHCYRFVPFHIDAQQLSSIHGIDENVDLSTLVPAVKFYRYLYMNEK